MSEVLLTRAQVERRVGLKRSAIYDRMARGLFPKPVPDEAGRSVRWVESEIDAYVAARIAARKAA
jgi:prophage regulatory protein